MRTVCTWTLITLAIALIPAVALAQSQTRPRDHGATYNRHLQIGPIPGLTTAWHPAPTETAVPLGATLSFKATGDQGASVQWAGARVMERRHGTSSAECYLATPGPHTVTIEYTDAGGERRQESSRLNVIDTSVYPISFSRLRIWADPVLLDESATNEETMRYYFGDSIAAVREIGEGRYLTSTNRWFHLEVDVEPAGFAPLAEWRLNGVAQQHLGTAIQMQVFPARAHAIETGLVDNPQTISLETYMVFITSHKNGDAIPDGESVVFRAVTDPPGYEDEITWLASTKYGSCNPLMGRGATFAVSFENTLGPEGRWLGVRSDNVGVGFDQKAGDDDDCDLFLRVANDICHNNFFTILKDPTGLIDCETRAALDWIRCHDIDVPEPEEEEPEIVPFVCSSGFDSCFCGGITGEDCDELETSGECKEGTLVVVEIFGAKFGYCEWDLSTGF